MALPTRSRAPKSAFIFLILFFSILGTLPASALFKKARAENVPGFNREKARVILPNNYSEKKKWPLVLLLHGYTASGKLQDFYFGMSRRLDDFGFILLIPDGIKNSQSIRFWNATDFCCDFEKSGVDDSGYLQALVEKVKFEYRVDPKRVYIVGHSNGGFMANRLACDTQGVFAGIASFAGGTYKDLSKCKNQDPMLYLQIHAENDPVIAWENDKRFLTGAETVDYWVKRNSCTSHPKDEGSEDLVLTIPKSDTQVLRWDQCRSGADVVLWKIRSYTSKAHKPHTPLLKREFSDGILKFLLNYTSD